MRGSFLTSRCVCFSINLVLLVPVQKSFCPGDVIGQLVSVDQGLHLRHPAGQVPEVRNEALQTAGGGREQMLCAGTVNGAHLYWRWVGHVEVRREGRGGGRGSPVGVVEAGVAFGSQGADLLPVGDELVPLLLYLIGVLGVRLLQTLRLHAQGVDLGDEREVWGHHSKSQRLCQRLEMHTWK